jgi:hypothetical protein
LSLSAESETPLGFAQHLFFLKIGRFYPPIQYLSLATLVIKGGLCPPFGAREVKGFALKTRKGLRPSTLQAFEKA